MCRYNEIDDTEEGYCILLVNFKKAQITHTSSIYHQLSSKHHHNFDTHLFITMSQVFFLTIFIPFFRTFKFLFFIQSIFPFSVSLISNHFCLQRELQYFLCILEEGCETETPDSSFLTNICTYLNSSQKLFSWNNFV